MKKNKQVKKEANNEQTVPRVCNKLGDGGTYIGSGRLFKKNRTDGNTTANSGGMQGKSSNEIMDKGERVLSEQSAESVSANGAVNASTAKNGATVNDDVQEQEIIVPYGDYHTHSVFSDGEGTLEENIQHAVSIGLKEYAITDHAFKHKSSGITIANFQVQKRMVELYRRKYPNIKIFHALEGNIMGYSGLLDIDEYVNELDFLQMGFHKSASNESFATWWSFTASNLIFRPSKAKIEKNTLAYLRCIDRYPLKFVNHLNYGVLVNCKSIASACVERGTKIELNGKRVFFSQQEVDDMLETGVDFVVNSDAHKSCNVGNVQLPIEFAKEHGIPFERIVNLNAPLGI